MSAPTIRAAVLTFALSSWVEGFTQIRTVLMMPHLPRVTSADQPESHSTSFHSQWTNRIIAWLKRRGREMDETERTLLAAVDISTAILILQNLGQPMLPFLLSPWSATLPLPRSTDGFRPVKWHYLILTTVILSLAHEAERVSVSLAVDCVRKRRETRNKQDLGEVYVRGDEHHPVEHENENDEEQDDCLICAGVGADNPLSQSTSSISSASRASPMNTLGPLEAFCVTAPQKHVAHRSCFLSWHAAYRQQRAHLPPEQLELQYGRHEAARSRAASILDAAGFGHLNRYLRLPHETPWPPVASSQIHPKLTLMSDTAGSSSPAWTTSRRLATLLTATPPCPGCRSPVLLHFFSRPASAQNDTTPLTRKERVAAFIRLWVKHWRELVTGRTISYQLLSQWSFVMALLSMLPVSVKKVRWTHV